MAGENSHSIERKVFLGKESRNRDFKKKIDVAASSIHINRILNPSTQEEKDNRNLNASELVKTLGGQDSFNAESVKALKQMEDDDSKIEVQKKIAKERLVILGKSVFWDMKEGHDPVLQDLLGRASATEIDNMLPDPLKGLGKEVVKNVITNPSILKGLKKLDDIKQNYDLNNSRDKTLFLGKIEKVYDEMSEIEGLSGDEREQLYMVKAYLNTEMQVLSGGTTEKKLVESVIFSDDESEDEAELYDEEILEAGNGEGLWKFDESETWSDEDSLEVKQEKMANRERKIAENEKRLKKLRLVMKGGSVGRNSERFSSINIYQVRDILKEIEDSGRDVSDLSLNSRKFTHLIDVANGRCDVAGLSDQEKKDLSREIKMRLFLNDLYLATSDVHDIEGIAKVMIAFHKGDTDKTLDKEFISFFLKDGANGLPVSDAWDMRQEAYFNYGGIDIRDGVTKVDGGRGILDKIEKDSPDLVLEYANNYADKNQEKVRKDGREKVVEEGKKKFLQVGLLMSENRKYGIYKNYFVNFRNDLDLNRKEIVKNYMEAELIKKNKCNEKIAERAFELARKLSVATYTDSAANVAFADGDDYAELIMFKFLRYQDGVETGVEVENGVQIKKPAKNKPVGSIETIKYIDSLTPPWLATLTDKKAGRGMWRPVKAADINAENIDPKSESTYHFGSIILKKVQEAKMALMTSLTPKDALDPDKLQKIYDRLSKVVAEADKAGWNVLDVNFFPIPEIDGERVKNRSPGHLMKAQRFFRSIYVMGVLERATQSSVYGWTRTAYDEFVKLMMKSTLFTGESGNQDETFISKEQLDWINKAYRPKQIFKVFENIEKSRKRNLFR